MNVTEIAFVCYAVTDIDRATALYEKVLQLVPSRTFGTPPSLWIEYDIGPCTLAISNMAGEDWQPSRHGGSAALEVSDFHAAVDELRKAGVKFLIEPFSTPVCEIAVIADPDGNSITVHQRHRESQA
jgi:predicted enzyme related to lactoylglutathione lyase